MEKARRNGCSPSGVERAGILWLSLEVRKLENELALKQAGELAAALPRLAGKATNAADLAAVRDAQRELETIIAEEYEQVELSANRGALNAKAFAGMAREKRRSLRRFIEDCGGGAADGGYATDLLDFEPYHVERALLLVRGEAEPETDDERDALARWREKHGDDSP
jgi:hypothetical protein